MPLNIDDILDPSEQLRIAQETLRGRASDYLRISLLDPALNGGPERLAAMEAEIDGIRKHIKRLEKKVPAPPDIPAPPEG